MQNRGIKRNRSKARPLKVKVPDKNNVAAVGKKRARTERKGNVEETGCVNSEDVWDIATTLGVKAATDNNVFAVAQKTNDVARHEQERKNLQTNNKTLECTALLVPGTLRVDSSDSKFEGETQLFADKYCPQKLEAVLGHEQAKRDIEIWLQGRVHEPYLGRQVLMLSGPCGSGKTLLARMILQHHGYTVIELNTSDVGEPLLSLTLDGRGGRKATLNGSKSNKTGVSLDSIYQYGKSLTNLKGEKVALLLDDIDAWARFPFPKFKQMLVLHKKTVGARIEKFRKDKKEFGASQPSASLVLPLSDTGKRKRGRPRIFKKLDFGLPKAYPNPIICPVICTTACTPHAHKKLKTFADACECVQLSALSSDKEMRQIFQHVSQAEQLVTMTTEETDDLLRLANGDARKMLNMLNFLSRAPARSRSVSDQIKSNTDGVAKKRRRLYDCFPDVWDITEKLFVTRQKTSLEDVLYNAAHLDMLGDFVAENYVTCVHSLEALSAASELVSDGDVLCGKQDGRNCATAPKPLQDSIGCWGVAMQLERFSNKLRFPNSLPASSKMRAKRNLREQVRRKANGMFAQQTFMEQLEMSDALMRMEGRAWLDRMHLLFQDSKAQDKKITSTKWRAPEKSPALLFTYGLETVSQIEALDKFHFNGPSKLKTNEEGETKENNVKAKTKSKSKSKSKSKPKPKPESKAESKAKAKDKKKNKNKDE